MTADHVLAALKDIDFEHLVPELEAQLANYRKIMNAKKGKKRSLNDTGNTEKINEEDMEQDDDIEIIDD